MLQKTKERRSNEFHPIGWVEKYVLDAALDETATTFCHDYLTLYWAVRVSPAPSPRALSRVFDKLVDRHEPLRLRFVNVGEEWNAEILPKHPVGLIIEDYGPLSKDEQAGLVIEHARRPLTALSDALFEMRLLRFGPEGAVVMMRANHAILDAYSVAQMVDDLIRLILRIPLGPPPLSYSEHTAFKDKQSLMSADEKERFWSKMLLPPPRELNLGRAAKGLGPMVPSTIGRPRCVEPVLDQTSSNRVEAWCLETGASAYAVLHAAFSETLCQLGATEAVYVNGIFGRSDASLSSYVGASIDVAPIRFVSSKRSFRESIKHVSDMIAAAAEHVPTHHLEPDSALMQTIEGAGVDPLRFWVLAPMPTGRMKSSTFSGFFDKIMRGSFSVGPITLEQVPIPSLAATDAELELTISQTVTGYQATLYADSAGYTTKDLETIAAGIRAQLARV